MLDMGFVHDVKKVIAKLPAQRQNLMFSATTVSYTHLDVYKRQPIRLIAAILGLSRKRSTLVLTQA